MQKLKTRRSAAKRYKRSASGKFTRKNAFKGHIRDIRQTIDKNFAFRYQCF